MGIFSLFLMLILKGSIILSQKRPIDTDKPKINKINECMRCKVLADSFNTWFDKTSRGKHEGGDAAWEETKLKSYARSEMRLVEIQESLCSDVKTHQGDCYALAEEAEQVLERWWFHENYDHLDLYTWLCIDNLQHCCPHNHFGEVCTPCPRDKNNKICGGNGKCDGDGTRKGNGTCVCKSGYSGNNCDECATNFYNTTNICKPCHQSCKECYSNGPNGCIECAPGWTMEAGSCRDINECLDSSICKSNAFCVNREGSYNCKTCDKICNTCLGPGPTNCTSCIGDNVLLAGTCMTKDNQPEYIKVTNKMAAICVCLCGFMILMLRQSWLLGSFVGIMSIAIYYFYENKPDIRSIINLDHLF